MRVTSWSQLNSNTKFSLDLFPRPFCDNEQTRFKRFETIKNFKFPEFWSTSKEFNKIGNALFVSGPARNGNHLTMSLLDGHKDILSQPGEDFMLREFLSLAKEDESSLIKILKSNKNVDFLLNLSGSTFDKWKKLNKLKINNAKSNLWSGQQPENESHVTDYQDLIPDINYNKFRDFLFSKSKEISDSDNFLDIFSIYLKALQHLVNAENNNYKYPYLWVYSGLRRELFYLLDKTSNITCVCPIREFESFYFSYAKSRFGTTEIKQGVLDELWEHWRHKTIDYLLLHRKHNDKIIFIKYENLINDTKRTAEKLCERLGVTFNENMLTPTTLGIPNKGNSSYAKDDTNFGKIYLSSSQRSFKDQVTLPDEYYEIIDLINNLAL